MNRLASTHPEIGNVLDTVIHGDALDILKMLPDECIDAIVCDPPAGISFMNKEFDHNKGGRTQWVAWLSEIMRECMRVLKSGGHALVWSLPRTSHWTALALEDAGFEIRDNIYNLVSGDTILYNFIQSLSEEQQHAFMQILDGQREPSGITHIFGSGFPKSLSVDKAIDRMLGKEREVIGKSARHVSGKPNQRTEGLNGSSTFSEPIGMGQFITAPASEAAKQFSGFGSALKPACENWWLVRKPLAASSIAENVLQYGTGAINIDGTRIGTTTQELDHMDRHKNPTRTGWIANSSIPDDTYKPNNLGRFPSHLLLTHTPSCIQVGTKRVQANGPSPDASAYKSNDIYNLGIGHNSPISYREEDGMETVTAWDCPDFCPVRILDEQSGQLGNSYRANGHGVGKLKTSTFGMLQGVVNSYNAGHNDTGGASRYFQQLPALDDIPPYIYAGKASRRDRTADNTVINTHPTVKSLALSRYLVKLVTPKDGIVLDCFAGSGSILCGAILEGFHFVGIEREQEYVDIARKRIQHAMSTSGIQQPDIPLSPSAPPIARKTRKIHSSQLTLWDKEQA